MEQQANESNDSMMAGFRQGREASFQALFRLLYPSLCLYAGKIAGNNGVAEDIAEEAFIKVWNRRTDFPHFPAIRSFLYTTVRNACFDYLRKQQTQQNAHKWVLPLLQAGVENKMDLLIKTETYRELYTAIEELPERCRKVIVLSFVEGKTGKEVAATLDMEPSTVRSHKNRGIMLLRQRLKPFLSCLVLMAGILH